MQKFFYALLALCCACSLTWSGAVRAEENKDEKKAAEAKHDAEKKANEDERKATREAQNYDFEKDGQIDTGAWRAAVNGELADLGAEKNAEHAALWKPVLTHLKEKLEEYKAAPKADTERKAMKKQLHATLVTTREAHPLLWSKLVERVKAHRENSATPKLEEKKSK